MHSVGSNDRRASNSKIPSIEAQRVEAQRGDDGSQHSDEELLTDDEGMEETYGIEANVSFRYKSYDK